MHRPSPNLVTLPARAPWAGLALASAVCIFGGCARPGGPDGNPILIGAPGSEGGDDGPSALPLPATGPAQGSHKDYPLFVQAELHNAKVYGGQRAKVGRGLLRFGAATQARLVGGGGGCPGGEWYEVRDGGYVCSSRGFRPLSDEPSATDGGTQPDVQSSMPYRYVKVRHTPTLRLSRLPSASEALRIESLAADPEAMQRQTLVRQVLNGIYFLAVDEEVEAPDGTSYVRTVRGDYVRADHVQPVQPSPMRGQRLQDGLRSPLGFLTGPALVPVYRLRRGRPSQVGWGEPFGRRSLRKSLHVDGRTLWLTDDRLAIDEANLRIARRIERPAGIGAQERWLHIHLPQQTLVAYEGDLPVFATLVSTGKPGYDTPGGLYRIRHKYISITMSGEDEDGPFQIEEVPWTHYYHGSFAIHGAFWHSEFGHVRSHGCTNVAPEDAHWLYEFTAPEVPQGWHGVWELGTAIYITDQ